MAINETLMALGDYRFSIATAALKQMQRQYAYRWADVPVLNSKPRSQFTGPELFELTMEGVIYPYYKGGFEQIDQLQAQAAKGEPLRLVDGLGNDWGLVTVRKISEQHESLRVKGKPMKITFTITLKEYHEPS
ncbi:putative tape measure protein [Saliniradius amylolyticus]|uniref:Putative tape measure protein n=1 Tax=Saliniradius amylolyticus TaxID=2183582 RepID=A0A2S2E5C8_9ALTE|nr:phage tail protein [Saliniradius amylolyticus]AWL12799.1 putative tape measure protein [Saliniradius amylolyticus]